MKRPAYRKSLLVAVIAALVVLLAIGAAVFGGPALLEVPAVKAEIERKLSQAVSGQIAWDTLDVRLLPSPRGVIGGVRIEIPGVAKVRAQQLDVHLRLVPLFRGSAEIISFRARRVAIEIDIGPSAPGTPETATDPVAAYRSVMGPVVQAARQFAPDTVVELEQASIDIRAQGIPAIQLRDLYLHARTASKGLDVQAKTTGNFWGQLQLAGRVEFADLSAHVDLDVTDLRPQAWLDLLLAGEAIGVAIPGASLHAKGRTDAKTSLACDFELGAPVMDVQRGAQRLNIQDVGVKGTAATSAQETEVALNEVRLGALVPAGSASLKLVGPEGHPQLAADIPRLDLVVLRDAVLALAGDYDVVRTNAVRIRAGEVTGVRFAAKADAWSELFALDHLAAGLTLEQGAAVVPVIEQPATAIAGHVDLADGKLVFQGVGAQLGRSGLTAGSGRYSLDDGTVMASAGFDLDLLQALQLVNRLLPDSARAGLKEIESASGQLKGRASIALERAKWNAQVEVLESDASARLRQLPWPVSLRQGRVSASADRVSVAGLRGSIGASTFADAGAQLLLGSEPRLEAASGQALLSVTEVYPWLRSQKGLAESLHDIPAASGMVDVTLNRLTGNLAEPSSLDYDATLRPRQLRVEMKGLAPVTAADGTIRIDRAALKADRLALTLLDARATVSGTVTDYRGERLHAEASIADGAIGEKLVAWLWRKTDAPERLQPKTPLRFSAQRVAWGPGRALEAQVAVRFEQGTDLSLDLTWKPSALEVRRLAIKDRHSDAVVALLVRAGLLQAKFSGSFSGPTVVAMLKNTGEHPGRGSGDLRLVLDRKHRELSSADGYLKGEGLNLTWLVGQPVKIDRIDLTAEGSTLHIREAVVNWAEQVATISGEVRNGAEGPVIDAQIDSPGIVVDALLPAQGPPEPQDEEQPAPPARDPNDISWIWPLPVTGRIQIRSDFIQYQRHRLAPVAAELTLEEQRAQLDVQQAILCGISLPLTAEVTPPGIAVSAHVSAQHQQVEDTARCMSDERLLITGEFDAEVALTTKGRLDELARNLDATVQLEMRDGEVNKFPLLGNILALKNVAGVLKKGTPHFGSEGFPYRRLLLKGRLSEGRFLVEESAFDSDAVGVVAKGSVNLLDRQAELNVLVAPFSSIDRLVRKIPIIGYVLGGALTSIPVRVQGDYRDPAVVPLGPRAVSSELVGIFERTLKLPGRLVAPLSGNPKADAPPAQP